MTERPSLVAALRAAETSLPLNVPALGLPIALTPKTIMVGWVVTDLAGLLIEIAPIENDKRRHERAPESVRFWVERSLIGARQQAGKPGILPIQSAIEQYYYTTIDKSSA